MNKIKMQKGITLIALIITIVVLLILAIVTIGAVRDSRIIGHAQNATADYIVAQEKELIGLGYSEYQMSKYTGRVTDLNVEGATVTENNKSGWKVEFETGNSYNVNLDGNINIYEPVINKDPDGWEIAYLYNGNNSWTEFTEVDALKSQLTEGQIVAKFYQQDVAVEPKNFNLNGELIIPLPASEISYKLFIEGSGEMGDLIIYEDERLKAIYGYQSTFSSILDEDTTNDSLYIMPKVTEITICDGITSIGKGAFAVSASLEKVTISQTVTNIDSYAFLSCTKLSNITIPSSVNLIGAGAFQTCEMLEEISIPDSVTEIADYTFAGCSSLTKVKIPSGVIKIGERAFWECTNLVNIVIPSTLNTLGEGAFETCRNLTNIYIETVSSQFSVGTYTFSETKSGGTIFVRNLSVANALSGKNHNLTISTEYNWTAPVL